MSSWRHVWLLALCLLLQADYLTSTTTSSHDNEDDFAFDSNEEIQSRTFQKINSECSIRRLWGVPDMSAYIGHLFKLQIPKEAFSGNILSYKIVGIDGTLPSWLILDKHKGLIRGVPDSKDYGEHRLVVTAMPFSNYSTKCPLAKDIFTIEVKDKKEIPSLHTDIMEQCHTGQSETYLKIIVDYSINELTPKQKISAIHSLSSFMGIDEKSISLLPHDPLDEKIYHREVLMSGIGDRSKKSQGSSTAIQFLVGCSGKLWEKQSILIHQIRKQAKEGTISFVLRLPVISWKVITIKLPSLIRKQRQTDEGSTEYDDADEDFSGYDEDIDYEPDHIEEVEPDTPPRVQPTLPLPTTAPPETPHHHRHHHGEIFIPPIPDISIHTTSTTEVQTDTSSTTEMTTTQATLSPSPTSVFSIHEISLPSLITTLDNTSQMETETSTFLTSLRTSSDTPRPTVAYVSPTVEISTFESPITYPATLPTEDTSSATIATSINDHVTQDNKQTNDTSDSPAMPEGSDTHIPSTASSEIDDLITDKMEPSERSRTHSFDLDRQPFAGPHDDIYSTNITSLEATPDSNFDTIQSTTNAVYSTTERASTIIGKTTETVEFTFPTNRPPYIKHRLIKLRKVAGKAFSYIVPVDIFDDPEDGKNLKLQMYDNKYNPLKSNSWIQFKPETREVYGLPLEDHVSKWDYAVEATDSQGANVNDTLDITIQQHKGRRTVNHEFSMKLRVSQKYPAMVDWQIRALRGLVNLFRDTDMDQLTVINVNLDSDPIEFVWTNDTLPRDHCPKSDIDRLMGILQDNSDGTPSAALVSAMSPDLIVKSVTWKGTGTCQGPPSTPAVPELPDMTNHFSPMPRNQIDQLNATVGKLFIFKVPEDTFYDHEDGNARNLKIWLAREDRSPIPAHNWLQFDTKNQEFYGVPLDRDVESKKYQLVCEDRAGQTAYDVLVVDVHSGSPTNWSFEFKMAIDTPYDSFINNALAKRKFIEKLYTLFDDKSQSSIKIKSITDKPTVVSWYNISLPTDRCPHKEIEQLKKVLIDDKTLTERVHSVMGTEFPVNQVSFSNRGICFKTEIILISPDIPAVIPPNEDPSKRASTDDYIITYIVPIAVIVCMIIISSLIACILYRRRHSGKMSVGNEEECQPFRSKGIPVIFQDELEEKPEATNKTPIIMKEEKPPLFPPPEYRGADSGSPTPSHTPYHPPPPFTASRDNARNNRPKPTPTYRKPPPYVPP